MKRGEHDRLRGPFKHFREMLMTLTTVTQLANSMPLFQRTQWYDVDQFRQLGIPQPGDRVKFKRKRNGVVPYTHWGIVEKVDVDGHVNVIHFTPGEGARKPVICESSLDVAAGGYPCAIDNTVDNVHNRLPTDEILRRARSKHWCIVEDVDVDGNVSVIHFTPREGARKAAVCEGSLESAADGCLCIVDNTADEIHDPLPTPEILERARLKIGNTDYHFLFNNCEVFATWCRNGILYCEQVERFLTTLTELPFRNLNQELGLILFRECANLFVRMMRRGGSARCEQVERFIADLIVPPRRTPSSDLSLLLCRLYRDCLRKCAGRISTGSFGNDPDQCNNDRLLR
ncbi:NC domain protein [Aphelenchoides avenae]|nr:NC domain protein [Aphelenchus avenae]